MNVLINIEFQTEEQLFDHLASIREKLRKQVKKDKPQNYTSKNIGVSDGKELSHEVHLTV